MSGLQAAIARMGAIERLVAGVRDPAMPAAAAATSFAAELDEMTAVAAGPRAAAVPAGLAAPQAPAAIPLAAPVAATPVDPAYRPAHVTETDERVWNDCTWASAAMWIDKLTGGELTVDREALRTASGDLAGGSSLRDVVRGARKLLGMDLRPAFAERLTLDGLLDRLAAGGGAIVQGSYASLPAHLARHDPGFAAKGVAASGHAVYVGPLDRATGKVWWDDPLAPAGGSGEWISVRHLERFAWTDGQGRVSAMATPAGSTGVAPVTTAAGGAGRDAAPAGRVAGATRSDAASITAAAWTAGVDPLLLAAYLRVTHAPSDAGAIAGSADELAAALACYGRADLALEQLGTDPRSGGSAFAARVLRQWAGLLERGTGA